MTARARQIGLVALVLTTTACVVCAAPVTGRSFTNTIGMTLVWISDGYWAGQCEVTQAEYEKVTGTNPSKRKAPRNPVEMVNWHDAMEFCRRLTEQERKAGTLPEGFTYTLPTERQWDQLAAEAPLDQAIFNRFGPNREPLGPAEAGSRNSNQLGLHDIRGNVWEWCLDLYMPNSQWRVLRGGAWSISDPDNMDPKIRLNVEPETRYDFYGFRCVLVPVTSTP